MIQVLSVVPCSRALKGPNGFHIKAASFARYIYAPETKDIDFAVCLRVDDEPPPIVEIYILDPFTDALYYGDVTAELDQVSPVYEVRVTVRGVIRNETGEHAFRLYLNGEPVFAGPLWGYNK